jgi:hypothetical protein
MRGLPRHAKGAIEKARDSTPLAVEVCQRIKMKDGAKD